MTNNIYNLFSSIWKYLLFLQNNSTRKRPSSFLCFHDSFSGRKPCQKYISWSVVVDDIMDRHNAVIPLPSKYSKRKFNFQFSVIFFKFILKKAVYIIRCCYWSKHMTLIRNECNKKYIDALVFKISLQVSFDWRYFDIRNTKQVKSLIKISTILLLAANLYDGC